MQQNIIDNLYIIISEKASRNSNKYFEVRDKKTKIKYTIEILNKKDPTFIVTETKISLRLKEINNSHILKYIGIGFGPLVFNNKGKQNKNFRIFENVLDLDLFEKILKIEKGFSEKHSKLIFKKILLAINDLHKANICHRDITIENILLDENYDIKISSIPIHHLKIENLDDYTIGTKCYMAPEILSHIPYNGIKVDIFSLGQLLFNLVTNMKGFEEASDNDILYTLIKNQKYDEYWKNEKFINKNLSESFKNLYLKMVDFSPNKRPSIDEILKDDWLKEINDLNEEQMISLENEVKQEFKNREAKINR